MESVIISHRESKRSVASTVLIIIRIVFYSFWLVYLIRAPSSTIKKLIIFGFMVTGFMILTIKIPEWATIDQSSITNDDNSIQDISNPNIKTEVINEYMRDIPVILDIIIGISTLILGIIVTIL